MTVFVETLRLFLFAILIFLLYYASKNKHKIRKGSEWFKDCLYLKLKLNFKSIIVAISITIIALWLVFIWLLNRYKNATGSFNESFFETFKNCCKRFLGK